MPSPSSPEMPYLAAGAIALVGGVKKYGGIPPQVLPAALATAVLVTVASAASGTRVAPLVRAVGVLAVLAASMATLTQYSTTRKD